MDVLFVALRPSDFASWRGLQQASRSVADDLAWAVGELRLVPPPRLRWLAPLKDGEPPAGRDVVEARGPLGWIEGAPFSETVNLIWREGASTARLQDGVLRLLKFVALKRSGDFFRDVSDPEALDREADAFAARRHHRTGFAVFTF